MRGYEVTRDGRVLETLDALSYVDSGLVAGATYVYGVTAIDRAGQRSDTATVRLTMQDADGSGGSGNASAPGPAAPSDLTGRLYSSRSGAIAWARPSTFGLSYDVFRDGRLVETTTGTSYHDHDLGGTRHTYRVVAKDREGRTSAAATVTLDPNERDSPSTTTAPAPTAPTPVAPGTPPAVAAPTGLEARVYSSRSAGISWARPATVGLRYDVFRDGRRLETIDGLGHHDDSLSPGRSYTYEVVAIDREGRRSAASSIVLNTPQSSASPAPEAPATPETPALATPDPTPPVTPSNPDDAPVASWEPTTSTRDLAVPAGLYQRDGYGDIDVVRFDIETVTTEGTCTIDDQSGCTLEDVIADIDPDDDFKVDIPVRFAAPDFTDDGLEVNAGMRQRGATSRQSEQKSFRVEFDGKGIRWRDEDKLQINKHPQDPSKIRNKLAFDLMARIPNFPSSNTQFVNLWIDDGEGPVDYGVFTHAEASSEEYFEQRDWDEDGKFYKAEKFLFSGEDLRFMALDDDGEPEDKDAFESRLEIQYEGDDDHRALIEMVRAINDPDLDFDDVLDRHFDRDNLVTWVTVNILLRQLDAVTHNWYLYNPGGTERFYMLPWDYDQTFGVEPEPDDGFATDALAQRLFYGFGKGRASNLLGKLYERPGFYDAVLAKAETLRNGPFAESTVNALAARYAAVVGPIASRGPDRYKYKAEQGLAFGRDIGRTLDELRGGYLPLPPYLSEPRIEDGTVEFRWSDAHDVTARRTLSYDLEVSTSPEFRPEDRLLLETRIPDDGDRISLEVPVDRLGSGRRYVRLVARADEDPSTVWQIASNRETIDGEPRIGIRAFVIP